MASNQDIPSNPNSITLKYRRTLVIIIVLHFSLLLAMGLFRHWGNMSNLHDLGVFDQAVWGTLHGQWFHHTINTFGQSINWLSFHFNLFLLLFVPLYAIWPSAEWFTIAQAIALSVAAWPIFLLARRVLDSERTSLFWAVIYLLNPFLLSAAAWDFHPVMLAVPFIAGALLAVEKKSFRLLMICCLCLLLIQEQFGITTACFGTLWWFKYRNWKNGLILIGIGAMYTVIVIGFIMPALSPTGTHSMIDSCSQYNRYGWLGGSPFEILSNIVLHPFWLLKTVLSMENTISYWISLAIPFLGLSFVAPVWLLPASADFAANTLSANTMPRGIISYHSVTLIPIMTVSAIYGARRIAPLLSKKINTPLATIILLFTIALSYRLAPLPLPGSLNSWQPVEWVNLPDPDLKEVRELVANSSSVSVQANIGAHFSQHRQIYRYPYKVGKVDTIVLRLDSPTCRIAPHEIDEIGTLSHHLQMAPGYYLASIECLMQDPSYNLVLWRDPWLVATRKPNGVKTEPGIKKRVDSLRHSWQITSAEQEIAVQECLKPM